MIYSRSMEKELIKPDTEDFFEINEVITNNIIQEHSRLFATFTLEDRSYVGVLFQGRRFEQETNPILPPFEYIVVSKYGLTLFNCSYTPIPLEWERVKKSVEYLVERSHGEILEDFLISSWQRIPSTRKTKGLKKLKMNIRSVLVSGVHFKEGLEPFYNSIFKEACSKGL